MFVSTNYLPKRMLTNTQLSLFKFYPCFILPSCTYLVVWSFGVKKGKYLAICTFCLFTFQKQPFYSSKGHLSLIKRAPFADQKDSFHFLPPFGRVGGGFFSKNTSPPPLFVWNADKHRGSGRGGVAQTPPLTPPPTPPLQAYATLMGIA